MGSPLVVIACISEQEYDHFLQPHDQTGLPFRVIHCDSSDYDLPALIRAVNEHQAAVMVSAWSTPYLSAAALEQMPGLHYVCHLCGEVRPRLAPELIDQGLLVTNWGEAISRTVAEHVLMQILASLRRVTWYQLNIHMRGQWHIDAARSPESLFHQRVGIFGFGSVARNLLPLLHPFGCHVQAYSSGVPAAVFAEYGVTQTESLEALFEQNRIVICAEALTPTSHGVIDEHMLRRLEQGGVFINVGRGRIVDEQGLARVAARGQIHVALDVFHQEPIAQNSPLRGLDNVMLTPHVAGPTFDRRKDAGAFALENIRKFFAGELLQALVTSDRLLQMT